MNPFQSANAQEGIPQTAQATRVFRRVQDGRLFERTGEKRQLQRGEFHWCDGLHNAPTPYEPTLWQGREDRWCENCGNPDREHVKISNPNHSVTLQCPHVCPIWRLAEDQEQDETLLRPKGIEWAKDPIDRLIQKVELTRESVEDADVLTRASVLASLYQAKALDSVEFTLREMLQAVERSATALEDYPRPSQPPVEWPWFASAVLLLLVFIVWAVYVGMHK